MSTIEPHTYYTIATKDGRYLTAISPNEYCSEVQLLAVNPGDLQLWQAVPIDENACKLLNKATGKVLDIVAGGKQDGAWLHLWENVNTPTQLWQLQMASGGVKIVSLASGKVLDIVDMSAADGAHVQIWEDVNGENQVWKCAPAKSAVKTTAKTNKRKSVTQVITRVGKAAKMPKAEIAKTAVEEKQEKPAKESKPAKPAKTAKRAKSAKTAQAAK